MCVAGLSASSRWKSYQSAGSMVIAARFGWEVGKILSQDVV
jgi:hypothetical protein